MDIDEGLYSRQLYVLGKDAQRSLQNSSLLVIGMDGIGVEIAKNAVLAGIRSVIIVDDTICSERDMGSNFYITNENVQKKDTRANASVKSLSELNPYVKVAVAPFSYEKLVASPNVTNGYFVIVMTIGTFEQKRLVNNACRQQNSKFIAAGARGLFCYGFCDFGDKFVIQDKNGEEPITKIVASVTKENPGLVTVHDEAMHGLEDGDYVIFSEVVGMTQLNGSIPRPIKVKGPFTFEIENTLTYDEYQRGGYVTQVKTPITMAFKSLADSLKSPGEILLTDFAKIGRAEMLHVAFQALEIIPNTRNDLAALQKAMTSIAQSNNIEGHQSWFSDAQNVLVLRALLNTPPHSVLSPIAAFLGGVLGQEVIKACTGKFTPLHQWLFFDAFEALTNGKGVLADQPENIPNSRYQDEIAIFGSELVNNLHKLNLFLVGAGAIGCEMLKNWALMGVSLQKHGGAVHITDMDKIEKSNLNRQFLFRSNDVGKFKSAAAASAAKKMNPEIEVKAYQDKVAPDTESVFGDKFFGSLGAVVTALDNVEARLYVDQRCVTYGVPLLDSGTLGTKGNTQVVIPHLTENYGASRDPPEKSIPICTLKNFPHAIEHTLQWGRDWFEGAFTQNARDVNGYLSAPDQFLDHLAKQQNSRIETLESIRNSLVTHRPRRFEECIEWARLEFEDKYVNQIKQLLHTFPSGTVTSTGTLFWSGTKREPKPIEFDPQDPTHMGFIIAAANLHAYNYGLKGTSDPKALLPTLAKVSVPVFAAKTGLKIAANDEELEKQKKAAENDNSIMEDVETTAKRITKELPDPSTLAGYRMSPCEFEKDDDTNFHMDFITAASNLRARNYGIGEADKHKSKFIAGRIIPAIATTTALVTGLVCIELYKVVAGKKTVDDYKNSFINLALPLFAMSSPIEAKKTKAGTWLWTIWDKIVLDGSKNTMTLQEFINYFEEKYGVEVQILSYGVVILYSMFGASKAQRLKMTVPEAVESATKKPIPSDVSFLQFEICCTDPNDDKDVELPAVTYKLR